VACSGALGVYISLTPMRLFACSPGRAVKAFEAQLAIVELLEHKALFTAGYKAVMHCHTVRPSTQRREVELIRFSLASNSSNSSLPLDALVAPLSHTHRVRRGVVGS
jgi:hypothetical protein